MQTHFQYESQGNMNLTDNDLIEIRQALVDMKESLLTKAREFQVMALPSQEAGMDEAEISQNDVTTNLAIELQERDRLTLLRIERALQKIQTAQYGVCESCGASIGPARLKAQPLARLCIDCKMDQESQPLNTH